MDVAMRAPRRIRQANPPGRFKATLRGEPKGLGPYKVRDVTLPRKTAKESSTQPYLKPTQVDKVSIQRRLREHSLRN